MIPLGTTAAATPSGGGPIGLVMGNGKGGILGTGLTGLGLGSSTLVDGLGIGTPAFLAIGTRLGAIFSTLTGTGGCFAAGTFGGGEGVLTAAPLHLPSGVRRSDKLGFAAIPFTADFTGGTGASAFAFLQAGGGTGNSDLTSPSATFTSDPGTYDREG